MIICHGSDFHGCRFKLKNTGEIVSIFPEIKEDFDIFQQAVIQLFSDIQIHRIYYHEYNGDYWVNLDYTARHPGGPYMNDKVKLVIEP